MSTSPALPARSNKSPRENGLLWVLAFVGLSLVIHVVGFAALGRLERPVLPPAQQPVEMVVVEVEPPPEPEPEPPPPPPKEKPPPVQVAKVSQKPPPEPPKEELPPPPNEPPPEEAPKEPPPLVVGMSMSSTTSTGGFAAPVGNTVYGKTANTATNPKDVKGYSAPKYMPVYQVDSPPELVGECEGRYPDEAKRLGIEGDVILSLVVDNAGQVKNVKLVNGLGYGLDEAAMDRIRRCQFKPAHKGGEAVSTEIKYKFRFVLD